MSGTWKQCHLISTQTPQIVVSALLPYQTFHVRRKL